MHYRFSLKFRIIQVGLNRLYTVRFNRFRMQYRCRLKGRALHIHIRDEL